MHLSGDRIQGDALKPLYTRACDGSLPCKPLQALPENGRCRTPAEVQLRYDNCQVTRALASVTAAYLTCIHIDDVLDLVCDVIGRPTIVRGSGCSRPMHGFELKFLRRVLMLSVVWVAKARSSAEKDAMSSCRLAMAHAAAQHPADSTARRRWLQRSQISGAWRSPFHAHQAQPGACPLHEGTQHICGFCRAGLACAGEPAYSSSKDLQRLSFAVLKNITFLITSSFRVSLSKEESFQNSE